MDAAEESHTGRGNLCRLRYLIDIVILAAATVLVENAVAAVFLPTNLLSGAVFDVATKTPPALLAWLLLRVRHETLSHIGLRRPRSWSRALLVGVLIAAAIFVTVYLSEKAGYHRNLSQFKAVKGNLPLTLYGVLYAFLGAGFYEEFIFRGFLFCSLAMFLGGSRVSWIAACIIQAALFGLGHSYQNPLGIAITGTIGLLMGGVFLACGRNLWPPIIGHGLYDAARFILFYYQGPPAG